MRREPVRRLTGSRAGQRSWPRRGTWPGKESDTDAGRGRRTATRMRHGDSDAARQLGCGTATRMRYGACPRAGTRNATPARLPPQATAYARLPRERRRAGASAG